MNIDPSGLDWLCVHGSDDHVDFSELGYAICKPNGVGGNPSDTLGIVMQPVVEMRKPTKAQFLRALISMDDNDSLFFWGHGAGLGTIWVNDKETVSVKDLRRYVDVERKRAGRGRIKWAELHACDTFDSRTAVKGWLSFARRAGGYVGLTARRTGVACAEINPLVEFGPEDCNVTNALWRRLPAGKR